MRRYGPTFAPFLVVSFFLNTSFASAQDGTFNLKNTLENTRSYILSKRKDSTYWEEPMGGDVSLDALMLALGKRLGKLTPDLVNSVTHDIFARMPSLAGWNAYPGGAVNPEVSAITLVSLEQVGISRDDPRVKAAWEAFDRNGGFKNLKLYASTFLSLVGLMPTHDYAVTPKFMGLPENAPVNVKKLGIVGDITVPIIAIGYLSEQPNNRLVNDRKTLNEWLASDIKIGHPTHLDEAHHRTCLLPEEDQDLPALLADIQAAPDQYQNCVFKTKSGHRTFREKFLRFFKSKPSKKLLVTLNFILDHTVAGSEDFWVEQAIARVLQTQSPSSGGWYGTMTAMGALRLLEEGERTGLGDFSDRINQGWNYLLKSRTLGGDGYGSEQFMFSGTWDTASVLEGFALLKGTPLAISEDEDRRTVEWLLKQSSEKKGTDGSSLNAWSFDETAKSPDVDTTAYVIHTLTDSARASDENAALAVHRGIAWILEQQNKDGGFAVWEKNGKIPPVVDKVYKLIFSGADLPFKDISQSDVTGRVLTMLADVEPIASDLQPKLHASEVRACDYLASQMPEVKGIPVKLQSGTWMTNYVYSAAANLTGLSTVGCHAEVQANLASWIMSTQNNDGGWGESNESYTENTYVHAPSTLSQTATALIGLEFYFERFLKSGQIPPQALKQSIENGLQFISQKSVGGTQFFEEEFTGVILKNTSYCRYELVPAYTSLFILAKWRMLTHAQDFD